MNNKKRQLHGREDLSMCSGQAMVALTETIVAESTPKGEGAISVVRLSGPEARVIGQKVAPHKATDTNRRMVQSTIKDAYDHDIDNGLLLEMWAPHSYTGEDMVEIHVHGSPAVVALLIEACVAHGARLAEPGEFTLRAFLNGKMDLCQAEAVADVIASKSRAQLDIANRQLKGHLSASITAILEDLESLLAIWQAALDFPDDVSVDSGKIDGEKDGTNSTHILNAAKERMRHLIDHARTDLHKGVSLVLCGAPNAGKSTLLNALAGEKRVLVDDAPGTTRDPVEILWKCQDILVRVWDTAGFRLDAHGLEADGIEMGRQRTENASVALWLVAGDDPVWPPNTMDMHVIGSKKDVTSLERQKEITRAAKEKDLHFLGWISALNGDGMDTFCDKLNTLLNPKRHVAEQAIVVKQRHLHALQEAAQFLHQAEFTPQRTLDICCMDLESACKTLGSILGRDIKAEVLDRIFSEFCIGK